MFFCFGVMLIVKLCRCFLIFLGEVWGVGEVFIDVFRLLFGWGGE